MANREYLSLKRVIIYIFCHLRVVSSHFRLVPVDNVKVDRIYCIYMFVSVVLAVLWGFVLFTQ